MYKRRFSQQMLASALAFLLLVSSFGIAIAEETSSILIFHTNDFHSRVEASDSQAGYGRISTIVKKERDSGASVLLLDAGDALHGQSIGNLSQGESIIKIMNRAGYDAMTAGNHDFNYGQTRLLELRNIANFPILGANILNSQGGNFLDEFLIKEIGGKKVLIMGLSTPETTYKTHPKNVEGLVFIDPVESAKQIVAANRSNVDFIIALSHLGQEGEFTSKILAEKVNGIDLIIDGHSHDKGELKVGTSTIVQTGEYGQSLGKIIVSFSGEEFTITTTLLTPESFANVEGDKEILDIISEYQEEVNKIQSVVIGTTTTKLEGTRDLVRTQETNLGNLITDAILETSDADLALTNGGGIRASINSGEITGKNVFDVLPFGNLIVVKEVPGSVIKEMLEFSVRLYPESNGGFLHGSGITFAIDDSKEALSRIHDVRIQGIALDLNKTYRLATNDFLAAGGDGYKMLSGYPVYAEMISLEESLADYIDNLGGIVTAKSENRIRIAKMLEAQTQERNMYIVRSGDNLSRIAAMYGMTWQDLQKVNNLRNPNLIYPNQEILIPAS